MIDTLRDFLKNFRQSEQLFSGSITKTEIEVSSRKSKDNLFAQCFKNIIEHPNRLIRLSIRLQNNLSCIFSIQKYELHDNQFILTEIVNLNHPETSDFYNNC